MAEEQSANQPLSQNEERDNNQLCPGGKFLKQKADYYESYEITSYEIKLHVKDPSFLKDPFCFMLTWNYLILIYINCTQFVKLSTANPEISVKSMKR